MNLIQISKGEFLAYSIHDVHLNESLYPKPEKWNPDRWNEAPKESTTWPFLGWGVGMWLNVISTLRLTHWKGTFPVHRDANGEAGNKDYCGSCPG